MSYPSVDALQRVLVESVFHYAQDRKKAAGRALGTLRDYISFIPQAPFIFSGSIKENLLMGVPEEEVPAERIAYAV